MRYCVLLLCAAVALWAGLPTQAGPVQGAVTGYFKLEPGVRFDEEITFRGGQRACVIVEGDHDPVMNISVEVKDERGQVVAKDDYGGDFVAAIWYPPVTAKYRVSVATGGSIWNRCWVAIK